jgi:transposase
VPGQTKYKNCGRKPILSASQVKQAVAFVKKWRHKRFCTCRYIIQELRLPVKKRTLATILNDNGYFWKAVPKQHALSADDISRRAAWVTKYLDKTAAWWQQNMNLVLDGVTLTMPPKKLSGRQKHAAQRIGHMWMRRGEKADPAVHTFNRYGVQLGEKVPLWGGFTGGGRFTLRLWTPAPKMLKPQWEKLVPALKRAVDAAEAIKPERVTKRAKVWQDNESFLKCPVTYRRHDLDLTLFPPNSGDLNPIETVWARLRHHLAQREQEDLSAGRVLTVAQFRQRASQILQGYSVAGPGQARSFLEKLVRGMPGRLKKCKDNRHGRCGK